MGLNRKNGYVHGIDEVGHTYDEWANSTKGTYGIDEVRKPHDEWVNVTEDSHRVTGNTKPEVLILPELPKILGLSKD